MKVSVLMITYNHEKFIAQAIGSILIQEVNFDYEIVIGEDCSTDNTRKIVIDFQKEYPDKIKLLLPEKNLGMIINLVDTLKVCQGEYIALLEGDDYWTSSRKLQKQVDFLECHTECSTCFHNVNVVYEERNMVTHPFHLNEPIYQISKTIPRPITMLENIVVNGNYMQTCSVMFRSGLFGAIPDWYYSLPIGDWPLHILNAEHGALGYIDEILGTYRVHPGGIWSSNLSQEGNLENTEKMIYLCETIERYLNNKYGSIMKIRVLNYYYNKAIYGLYSMQKFKEAGYYGKRYLARLSMQDKSSIKFLLRVILAGQMPKLYTVLKSIKNWFKNIEAFNKE